MGGDGSGRGDSVVLGGSGKQLGRNTSVDVTLGNGSLVSTQTRNRKG